MPKKEEDEKKQKSVSFQEQDTVDYGYGDTEPQQASEQHAARRRFQRRNSKTPEMLGGEVGASLRVTGEQNRDKRVFDNLSESLEDSTISEKPSKRRKTEDMNIEPKDWQQREDDRRGPGNGERSPG